MDFKQSPCYRCEHRDGIECLKYEMTIYCAWRHINGCAVMGQSRGLIKRSVLVVEDCSSEAA